MHGNNMNEQMENLMYHAGLTAQGCWDEMDEYNHNAIEKFAELIVKECANELIKWKDEPFPYDPEFGARLIKTHFGIK